MRNGLIQKYKLLIYSICTAFVTENAMAMNAMNKEGEINESVEINIAGYKAAFEEIANKLNAKIELVKGELVVSDVNSAELIVEALQLSDSIQEVINAFGNSPLASEFSSMRDNLTVLINHLIYTPFMRGLLTLNDDVLFEKLNNTLFDVFYEVATKLLLLQDFVTMMYQANVSIELCVVRILNRVSCMQCAQDSTEENKRLEAKVDKLENLPKDLTLPAAELISTCASGWTSLQQNPNDSTIWGFLLYYSKLVLTLYMTDPDRADKWIDLHNERTKNFLTAYLNCSLSAKQAMDSAMKKSEEEEEAEEE